MKKVYKDDEIDELHVSRRIVEKNNKDVVNVVLSNGPGAYGYALELLLEKLDIMIYNQQDINKKLDIIINGKSDVSSTVL